VCAIDPVIQSSVVNFELYRDFSDRNSASVRANVVDSFRKTSLTFSSSKTHSKRCILLVITVNRASTAMYVG
jgi:hypothetical protein